MSELSHLREECETLCDKTGCHNWQIVHDTVGDRYVVVLAHDSDEQMKLEGAARLALEHLE